MRSSYEWRAPGAVAQVTTEEGPRCFYGSATLWTGGIKHGPWTGNRYGIGDEFINETQALKDMACFLFHEIEHYEIEGKAELLEKIGRGRDGAKSTFKTLRHDIEDELHKELIAWGELTSESRETLEEKAAKSRLFDNPKTGEQLTLF